MKVDVRKAISRIEKTALENLLQLYMYDFTEYTDSDVNLVGRYTIMPDFDLYWAEADTNYPFLIFVDDHIAGFAFVKNINTDERSYHYLAHFFILKKFRKKGIGKQAAKIIINSYAGEWELYQLERNIPAQTFWRRIITELTDGRYDERHENGRVYQTFIQ